MILKDAEQLVGPLGVQILAGIFLMLLRLILIGTLTTTIPVTALLRSAVAQKRSHPPTGCANQTPRPCAVDYISGGLWPDEKLLAKPKPTYPEAAKAKGISGSVFVFVLTDIEGNVTSATISSGPPLLQEATLEAAKQARFRPTKLSGFPIKIRVLVKYDFDLARGAH